MLAAAGVAMHQGRGGGGGRGFGPILGHLGAQRGHAVEAGAEESILFLQSGHGPARAARISALARPAVPYGDLRCFRALILTVCLPLSLFWLWFCDLPGLGYDLGVCACATGSRARSASRGRAGSLAVRSLRAGYRRALLSRLLAPHSRASYRVLSCLISLASRVSSLSRTHSASLARFLWRVTTGTRRPDGPGRRGPGRLAAVAEPHARRADLRGPGDSFHFSPS